MTADLARIETAPIEGARQATPLRPSSQLIAASLFGAGSIMAMVALVALYTATRQTAVAAHATWIPTGGLPLTGPNTALFTLLLSIPAMLWAQQAVRNDDRQSLWVAYGIVLLLGAAFVNAESFILTNLHLAQGSGGSPGIAKSNVALLIITIVGVHLAMLGAAMAAVLVSGFRTLGGRADSRNRDSVDAVALYWYVVVGLFALLWFAVYVMK